MEAAGNAIQLTIDIRLQRAAERALRDGNGIAHQNGQWAANGGAIVALDPRDGAVLALASNPTYKPSLFASRVDPEKVAPLLDEAVAKTKNYPGVDKATLGVYPPGSIWKPVTALAAMQEHLLQPYESIQCTPDATYGKDKHVFKNWDGTVNQPMTLTEALAQSCDTYFYAVGNRFYERGPSTGWSRLQDWAARFGFGSPTGLDIGTRGVGSSTDAGVAQAVLQERVGQGVEPGRLDPARDRPKGSDRDPAADDALLRAPRKRREARDALRRRGSGSVGCKGTESCCAP